MENLLIYLTDNNNNKIAIEVFLPLYFKNMYIIIIIINGRKKRSKSVIIRVKYIYLLISSYNNIDERGENINIWKNKIMSLILFSFIVIVVVEVCHISTNFIQFISFRNAC
jgi:hypothetical protein